MICFLLPEKLILSVQRRSTGGTRSWGVAINKDRIRWGQDVLPAEKDRRRAVRHRIAAMKMRADDNKVGVAFFIVELFFLRIFVRVTLGAGQTSTIDCIEVTSAPFASDVLGLHVLEGDRGGEESDDIGVFVPGNFSNGTGDAWSELSVRGINTIAVSTTQFLEARFAHEIVHDLACCLGDGKEMSVTVSTSSAIVAKLATKNANGRRVSVVTVSCLELDKQGNGDISLEIVWYISNRYFPQTYRCVD